MPDTDPAASALQPIRDRAGIVAKLGPPRPGDDLTGAAHRSAADVPRLLKAVEAALKAADRWATEAARLDKLARAEADPQSRIAISLRAQALEDCARELRAITAALAGKDTGDAGTR